MHLLAVSRSGIEAIWREVIVGVRPESLRLEGGGFERTGVVGVVDPTGSTR